MKNKITVFVICFALVMLVLSCATFKKAVDCPIVTSVLNNSCKIACSQQTKMDKALCAQLCDVTDDITSVVKKEWNIKLEKK